MLTYYVIMALAATLILLFSLGSERKQSNVYVTEIMFIAAVANWGYLAIAVSGNVYEAILANKIVYIGGCFLPLILFFTTINICNFVLPRVIKYFLIFYSFLVYGFVLTTGYSDFYYKNVEIAEISGITIIEKVYGPGHSFSTVLLYGYIIISVAILIYAFVKKRNVSYKTLIAICCIYFANVTLFLLSRAFDWILEATPLTYVITGIIMMFIRNKLDLCNVENGIAISGMSQQVYGYIVLDKNKRYMGSNELAQKFISELSGLRVETVISDDIGFFAGINKIIENEQEDLQSCEYHEDGVHLLCTVHRVYRHKRLYSYVIDIKDDSQRWKYIELLEESRAKADAANQAKTTFLAHMSHEIRTPINAVMGMSEMIMRESKEIDIYGYALDVNNAAHSLLEIINDILDVAKIEAGKLELINDEFDTREFIKNIYYMISIKAEGKSLEFNIDIDERIPQKMFGDAVRLRQVLINLLNNAVKYTHNGSVEFKISLNDDDNILFVIRDTGIGIKEEEIDRLFTPFERIEEKRNRNIEGTGLGMTIVMHILDMMGSKLNVQSIYGEGTEISFVLKNCTVKSESIGKFDINKLQSVTVNTYKVPIKVDSARVLVVDDNSINRKVFINLLKNTGLIIDEASDGKECIELAKNNQYDIMFIDHMMPVLDGVETLNELNKMGICTNVPKIMLTANAMAGEREKFINYGFDEFLSKPVNSSELIEVIKEFLSDKIINDDYSAGESEEEPDNIGEFDFVYAMNIMNSKELLMSVLRDFNDAVPDIITKLSELYEHLDLPDNIKQYIIQIHSLKSASASVGALIISKLSRLLEIAATNNDIIRINKVHPVLLEELKTHKEVMDEFFGVNKTAKSDYNGNDSYFYMLMDALKNSDYATADFLADIICRYSYPEEMKIIVDRIINSVKNKDADEGIRNINDLINIL